MVGQSNFAGNIAYDDLREWLAMAERLGEVRTVKGANCEEEIGLAAEAVLRAEHGPCVVFEDIPGCPKGFRLLLKTCRYRLFDLRFGKGRERKNRLDAYPLPGDHRPYEPIIIRLSAS